VHQLYTDKSNRRFKFTVSTTWSKAFAFKANINRELLINVRREGFRPVEFAAAEILRTLGGFQPQIHPIAFQAIGVELSELLVS
jgi:hypothetical protein